MEKMMLPFFSSLKTHGRMHSERNIGPELATRDRASMFL
jgi:hypothetical protein